MRPIAVLILFAFCSPLLAQQQESRMEQILRARERSYDFQQGKTVRSNAFYKSGKSAADPKPASLPAKFRAKDYLTGAFSGNKAYWAGDFKYSTKEAPTRSARESRKTHETKQAATSTFRGQKQSADPALTAPTRDYRGSEARRKDQGHLTPQQAANNGWKGDVHELKSIDDVRELLNKNK